MKGLSNERANEIKPVIIDVKKFNWRKESYTISILCINTDNDEMILVDLEGHSYARYVGLYLNRRFNYKID